MMKYSIIITLVLLVYNQHVYAEKISFNGFVTNFTCSEKDSANGCKALYQSISQSIERNRTINELPLFIKNSPSKFYNVSINPLNKHNAAVVFVNYN